MDNNRYEDLAEQEKEAKGKYKDFLEKIFCVLTNIKLTHKEILKSGDIYVGNINFIYKKKNKNKKTIDRSEVAIDRIYVFIKKVQLMENALSILLVMEVILKRK